MKLILVFQNGELIKQLSYKSKAIAKKQYNLFMKNGIIDAETGLKIPNATFEII